MLNSDVLDSYKLQSIKVMRCCISKYSSTMGLVTHIHGRPMTEAEKQ
jgi:hypothetical protein